MNARKDRPQRGDFPADKASTRDIEAAFGISRGKQWRARQVAEIPADEFEALIESDNPPTVTQLVNLSRRRAGLPGKRRRCPHCRGLLS